MNRTARTIFVVVGVACFVAAAMSAAGWIDLNSTALALAGFGAWLASTL